MSHLDQSHLSQQVKEALLQLWLAKELGPIWPWVKGTREILNALSEYAGHELEKTDESNVDLDIMLVRLWELRYLDTKQAEQALRLLLSDLSPTPLHLTDQNKVDFLESHVSTTMDQIRSKENAGHAETELAFLAELTRLFGRLAFSGTAVLGEKLDRLVIAFEHADEPFVLQSIFEDILTGKL